MHDKLYANFRSLSEQKIYQLAEEIGLDLVQFTRDLKSGKYRQTVEKELNEGQQAGVSGTPTVFVNGKHYNGAIDTQALDEVLRGELKTLAARATPSPQSR